MTVWQTICLTLDIFRWSTFLLLGFLAWRYAIRPAWDKFRDISGW